MIATTQSPWQPYDHPSKGKGRPVIPETPLFGAALVASILVVTWMRRKR